MTCGESCFHYIISNSLETDAGNHAAMTKISPESEKNISHYYCPDKPLADRYDLYSVQLAGYDAGKQAGGIQMEGDQNYRPGGKGISGTKRYSSFTKKLSQ
jgi:hypothetical protein